MQNKTDFNPTPDHFQFPEEEVKILEFWKKNHSFEQQLQKTKHLKPYTFYDGPPFATGTPHYGHIAAGTIKDVVCRYATQTQHYVSRKFGWDCHGLPVEYEIDKALGIKDKKQVQKMGIAAYNAQCRKIVMKYSSEWQQVINRFGRWIDFKNDYKTLDIKFMQSVWYVFKQLFNKGLVYRGRKIMPYSNGCTTVLSNFEVQLNYKDVNDPSLFITFPLVKDPQVKFLVWTTTPWTLPSNLALAVNQKFTYVKIKDNKKNQIFILAECRLKHLYSSKVENAFTVIETYKGSDLNQWQYQPLFNFFIQRSKDGCFRVQTANFVTDDAGTGVVHCAPGFGQQDYKMCVEKKIIHHDNPLVPLDANGKFTKQVPTYEGIHVKEADKLIIKDLKQKGRVFKSDTLVHSYPFCWRSQTPLIYKAVSAWFIEVTKIKQDLIKNNHKAYWVPKSIQQNRFNNWLKDAKDWCFSRNRYWGNPIPLWVSEDCEEIVCVGSLKQLQELTGQKFTDLHRQYIDHITIQSKMGKGKLRRIEQVFDCWFESGSMPYAQVHYPFSTSEQQFEKIFPADFIGEGIDQTRGWFYTLNVISTGVKNMNPYKNLIVNGLVLNENGKKMSKRAKNYPDPMLVCTQFGADAIRLYLINSPLVRAEDLSFSTFGVKSIVKQIFLPWYNAYRFLIQNISKYESNCQSNFIFQENIDELIEHFSVTDQWIQSSLQVLIKNIRKQMSDYKLYKVVPQLIKFLQLLTNWYVRLNRLRLKGQVDQLNMKISLNVLFDVLLKINVLMSPHVPFITEHMYQNMKLVIKTNSKLKQQSIHHLFIAESNTKLINESIMIKMNHIMSIVQTARKLREQKKISLKQPLMALTIVNKSKQLFEQLKPFFNYIKQEINIADILYENQIDKFIKLQALPNLPILGPKFKGNKQFGAIKTSITNLTTKQLQKLKEDGKINIVEHEILVKNELLIKQKFIVENIQEYQVIGGIDLIVLLDTRQNQELRIKGLAREIINKVQKLKKKLHLNIQDDVLIFYDFHQSKNLIQAMDIEKKTIQCSVKKPMLSSDRNSGLPYLAKDKGTIEEQSYEIYITMPAPILLVEEIKKQFNDKVGEQLIKCVLAMSYDKIKTEPAIKIILDKQQYLLEKNKHYECVI